MTDANDLLLLEYAVGPILGLKQQEGAQQTYERH